MRIDVSQSPALFALASERLGGHYRAELNHKLISVISPAGVLAQAVFTGIAPQIKAELTMWARPDRGLAGRLFLRTVFNVVFHQWQCKRLHAVTRESNLQAQRALNDAGFLHEATLRAWFGAEDGLMFRMLATECQWLKGVEDGR
jgi:hypothetical protein